LGHDFLRHIDRTKFLVHLVEAKEPIEACLDDYEVIISELKNSPYALLEKDRLVVLSKKDCVDESVLLDIIHLFKKEGISMIAISSFTKEGIPELIESIYKQQQLTTEKGEYETNRH